ncbi:hypothetical protein [Paenibacillus sp. OSY-SE]|uniref:hypothetical protein n=1 Tax=Paenibacillus sp. OSY-SE TaxID=1196323 RepID=UPI000373F60C|nr:hypothetical protein [Paenibacillus sp. OSY-SE]
MPGLIRSVNGTTTLFATASLKSKQAGILSANIELVINPRRGVSDYFMNVTQNACNLATIKLQSLTRRSSRLTASFGKQVKGITSANVALVSGKNNNIFARGFFNKKAVVPFKVHCGCKGGCSSTATKKVRFQDGTTLRIFVDKSLKLALKRLFAKLARLIKRRRLVGSPAPDCLEGVLNC